MKRLKATVTAMAAAKPTRSAIRERQGQARVALHDGRADPGQRTELGADGHRAHDQDRVVQDHTAGRDHRGEGDEGDVGDGERRLLVGGVRQVLPEDRVRGLAGRVLLRPVGPLGERQVDVLHGDGAGPVEVQRPQRADQFVARLARHVAHHDVSGGFAGGARHDDEVGGADRVLDQAYHLVGPAGRGDQAQMQHARRVAGPGGATACGG
jgi:hypothetical protein